MVVVFYFVPVSSRQGRARSLQFLYPHYTTITSEAKKYPCFTQGVLIEAMMYN
ncbi:hypothetical protein D3C85_1838110 [compost metagenome]